MSPAWKLIANDPLRYAVESLHSITIPHWCPHYIASHIQCVHVPSAVSHADQKVCIVKFFEFTVGNNIQRMEILNKQSEI